MVTDKPQDSLHDLETGNVDVQIHPVDPFHFQGDVLLENLGYAWWYGHGRLRLGVGLGGPLAASAVSCTEVIALPSYTRKRSLY
jgi:hypothetical protein